MAIIHAGGERKYIRGRGKKVYIYIDSIDVYKEREREVLKLKKWEIKEERERGLLCRGPGISEWLLLMLFSDR